MSGHVVTGRVVRRANQSLVVYPRRLIVGAVLLGCAIVLSVYAMTIGTMKIAAGEVWSILLGGEGTGSNRQIVMQVRLPRVLAGVCSGLALGAAGAVMQSVSRNPLGSPDVIGFTTGAATGALAQIIIFNGTPTAVALSALSGGVLTATISYLLSRNDGHSGGYRLILTGIGIGATLSAVNQLFLVMGDLDRSISANVWLAGSLNARTWIHVWPVLIGIVVLLPLLVMATRALSMIEMGDELAAQLGVRVERVRMLGVLGSIVLASLATASVGPIAFVALAAPQIAQRLMRASSVPILAGAVMGAFMLVAADLITQVIPVSFVVPIGRATGVIGGIYLIWLLTRSPGMRRTS